MTARRHEAEIAGRRPGHGPSIYNGRSIFAPYNADIAIDAYEGGQYVRMYVTRDGGTTWTQATLP